MTTYIIQPQTSAGRELTMESSDRLVKVPEVFCNNIGLAVVKSEMKKDPAGADYVEFTIGTGHRFIAFDKKILE